MSWYNGLMQNFRLLFEVFLTHIYCLIFFKLKIKFFISLFEHLSRCYLSVFLVKESSSLSFVIVETADMLKNRYCLCTPSNITDSCYRLWACESGFCDYLYCSFQGWMCWQKKPSRALALNPIRQVCGFLFSWVSFLPVVFLSLLSTFAFYCLITLGSQGGREVLIMTDETFDSRSMWEYVKIRGKNFKRGFNNLLLGKFSISLFGVPLLL